MLALASISKAHAIWWAATVSILKWSPNTLYALFIDKDTVSIVNNGKFRLCLKLMRHHCKCYIHIYIYFSIFNHHWQCVVWMWMNCVYKSFDTPLFHFHRFEILIIQAKNKVSFNVCVYIYRKSHRYGNMT